MRFFNFNQFAINEEKLGVSFASLIFSDFIEERIMEKFLYFYESEETALEEQDNIKWWRLQRWIKEQPEDTKKRVWELYSQFPVVGFEIILNFKKISPDSYTKKYRRIGAPIVVGGSASGFGHKNWKNYSKIVNPVRKISNVGLIIQIGINIECDKVEFDLDNQEHQTDLNDQIGSTLYHELNHSFEHYRRTTRAPKRGEIKKPVYDRSFNTAITYAENNKWKFAKPIWNIWSNKFLYYTYISEPHELNANVQEMYYYIKKYPDRELNSFRIWQFADYMEKFNPDLFYQELIMEIKKHNWKEINGESVLLGSIDANEIANRLKEMWVSVYKKEVEDQKTKPMIPYSTLDKMTCLDFIKYWSKKFNENGVYLKKKIGAIKYEEISKY